MFLRYLFLVSCIFSSNVFAQQKLICVSVDDLPTVSYGIRSFEFNQQLTADLIQTFKKYKIPAIGYVNEGKLYNSKNLSIERLSLLEMWLSNGFELGNHTFDHLNYDQVPFELFTENVLKGEYQTKKLAEKYGSTYQYFRHPYLRMGKTKEKADSLSNFLEANGYTIAPVTIDNEDYLFAKAYHVAYIDGNNTLMDSIGVAYVNYMEKKLLYYEQMSEKLFARNIAHTLLIHASLLNSRYLDELAEMYMRHGYTFESQSAVLKDPAYSTEITKFGPYGISWLDRWALSMGKKGDFFKNDPPTPEFIQQISNQ